MKPPIDNFKLSKYPTGSITQWFGENPYLYSQFNLAGHNGIDIVAPHGSPMYAVEDCTVLDVNDDPKGHGRHIRFISDSKDKLGLSNEWTYGHCDTILVKTGQKVKAGDLVATMGNTGFVVSGATPYWKVNPFAGTHLHLGLRKMQIVKKGGWTYPNSTIRLVTEQYDNGYKGAVDPYPVLAGLSDEQTLYRAQQLTIIALLMKLISLIKK